MNRMMLPGALDLADQAEQPLLELAAIGGAHDQGGHRQFDQAALSQLVGDLTGSTSAARPSTMAVLPTPARPISTGLFFFCAPACGRAGVPAHGGR